MTGATYMHVYTRLSADGPISGLLRSVPWETLSLKPLNQRGSQLYTVLTKNQERITFRQPPEIDKASESSAKNYGNQVV